jgi:ADP-ribose pyrophosphatase YjhB (NUDIX family)
MKAPGVGVAVLVHAAGRLLLVRRARPPAAGLWAFPGGRLELGESLEAAARRELREECGLELGELRQLDVEEAIFDEAGAAPGPGLVHWVIVLFQAAPLTLPERGLPAIRAGDDAAEVGWFDEAGIASLPCLPSVLERAGRVFAERRELGALSP